jgi:hypothetical protein
VPEVTILGSIDHSLDLSSALQIHWCIFVAVNATPDVREQLAPAPRLHGARPAAAERNCDDKLLAYPARKLDEYNKTAQQYNP